MVRQLKLRFDNTVYITIIYDNVVKYIKLDN